MTAIVYNMQTIRPGRRLARAAADVAGISRRLIAARLAAGLRPVELAAASGVGRNTIANWESGLKRPSVDQLAYVLPVLKVTLDYVFFGDDSALAWDVRARIDAQLEALPLPEPKALASNN